MLNVNVITSGEDKVITGTINGEKFSVNYFEDLYKDLLVKKAELGAINTMDDFDTWVEAVKELLSTETKDIITTACPDLMRNSDTGYYYVQVGDVVSKTPVPPRLVNIILESAEKDIDPTPIVKAWIRFLRNPNFTATKAELFADYITATIVDTEERDRLVEEEGFVYDKAVLRATYNDVAITMEGLIVGKKYAQLVNDGWVIDKETNKAVKQPLHGKKDDTIDPVTGKRTEGEYIQPEFNEELLFIPPVMGTRGDEFFCGEAKGHQIKVGQRHALETWDLVDTCDSRNCRPGLHIGGWQYVQFYSGLDCQLLECFVDPAEIGAICDIRYGGADGAMRVREYFIFGATEGRNKGIYHSSHYAAIKDQDWEDYKAKAIEESNELVDSLQQKADNLGL